MTRKKKLQNKLRVQTKTQTNSIKNIKTELTAIKKLYSIDKNKKDLFDEKFIEDDETTELANLIHDKLILLQDNEQTMKTILNKVYTKQHCIKELLEYELLYYKPPVLINDIDTLILKTQEILKKFQWKIGGNQIEDLEWIKLENDNVYIKIENCKVLMNTIEIIYSKDSEFLLFMNNIVNYISKHTENITVDFQLKNAFDICIVLITFQE
jgi:hypothetical protein